MKKTEINQSNKLIAKFMYPNLQKELKSGEIKEDIAKKLMAYNKDYSLMRYFLSWDWLMPVVEKIETKGFNVNVSAYPSIEKSIFANLHIKPYHKTQYTNGNRRDRTYKMCVEFIEWYNKNKS